MRPQSPARASLATSAQAAGVYAVSTTASTPFAPQLTLHTSPEWHVARRVAQAPSADIAAEIRLLGPSVWLDRQFRPAELADPVWDSVRSRRFSWLDKSYVELRGLVGTRSSFVGGALVQSLIHRPVFTTRVLHDSVSMVLGDHIYVPALGKASGHTIGFQRDVIEKFAFGKFKDLMYDAVTHPAILVLLDNVFNWASHPNENLGRELLELYTVGVGAFTEADVAASAQILTGLGVDEEQGVVRYEPRYHATGPVRVMGFSHSNTGSVGADGVPDVVRAYSDYLAHHPSTARRLAHRFAVHFVSDNPSDGLVNDLAASYLNNDTSLESLLRALFVHPEFWSSVGAKWARPSEIIGRVRRATKTDDYVPLQPFEVDAWKMGIIPWWYADAGDMPRNWPGVDGYPDTADAWAGSNHLLATWNAVAGVAGHWDDSTPTPDWPSLLSLRPGMTNGDAARAVTLALTGYTWEAKHASAVAAILVGAPSGSASTTIPLTSEHLRLYLRYAVHVVMSSPYAFLR